MAIKNASDLLVYRLYPAAISQVTRIKVKTTAPLDVLGTIKVLNSADTSGNNVAEVSVNISGTNNAANVLVNLSAQLNNNYSSTTSVVDGDYTYKDFTNDYAGDLANDISIVNGTATIGADAIIVEVITEGEDAAADAVAHSTSASISFNNDLRDVTTKDSAGFQENIGGLKSFELSTDALQDISADQDFHDFFSDISQRNEVSVQFSERGSGVKWEGSGYVSSLSMDAGVEENVTYSVTITGTGVVTKGTY